MILYIIVQTFSSIFAIVCAFVHFDVVRAFVHFDVVRAFVHFVVVRAFVHFTVVYFCTLRCHIRFIDICTISVSPVSVHF